MTDTKWLRLDELRVNDRVRETVSGIGCTEAATLGWLTVVELGASCVNYRADDGERILILMYPDDQVEVAR